MKERQEKKANFVEEKDKDESESLFLACYAAKVCNSDVWYMDSGCSNHMTAKLKAFISLDRSTTIKVKMGDGPVRHTQGKRVVKLNSCETSCIKDVLYVLDLDSNLLSVG